MFWNSTPKWVCVWRGKGWLITPKGFSTNSHYFLLLKDWHQSSNFKFQKCHDYKYHKGCVFFLNKNCKSYKYVRGLRWPSLCITPPTYQDLAFKQKLKKNCNVRYDQQSAQCNFDTGASLYKAVPGKNHKFLFWRTSEQCSVISSTGVTTTIKKRERTINTSNKILFLLEYFWLNIQNSGLLFKIFIAQSFSL